MYKLDENVLVFFESNYFILYHVISRRNLCFKYNFINFIIKLKSGLKKNDLENLKKKNFEYSDQTEFSLWNCLYSNANFRKNNNNIIFNKIKGDNIIDILKKLLFINQSKKKFNFRKKNLLDRFTGNLNEQIASEALFRKKNISRWWQNQKFLSNSKLKSNPYKIQEEFLNNYIKKNIKNKSVLEIGCGTGYYTNKISKYAKKVIGIDYEQSYLDTAKINNFNKNITYLKADISKNIIKNKNFDYIFMIDFFLFLFDHKFQKNLFSKKELIFKKINKLLKINGKLIIVDPHLFWLIPHFGNKTNPFGIITEYNIKHFSTIPTIEQVSNLFYKTGFVIEKISEPKLISKIKDIDEITKNFYIQFPPWIVYELKKK